MKYLWLGLALLAAVLACSLWACATLDYHTTQTIEAVYEVRACAERGDYEGALLASRKAQERWQQTEGLLGVLLKHDEADNVKFEFAELTASAEALQEDELLPHCDKLIAMLEHISEMEKAHYYNVF